MAVFFRSSVTFPFFLVATVLCFLPFSFARDGVATYYEDTSFACENEDPGTFYAAVGYSTYQGGAACGRRYTVSCIGGTNAAPHPCRGGSVTVKVVDLCVSCEPGHLDISKAAFSTIADPEAGKVRISYFRIQ